MTTSHGYRSRTRHKFKKPFRRNGDIRMKNYLQKHKKGDYVDIIVDGAIQGGMPHHFYHGRTGRIFNVNPRTIGIIINKEVRNRKIEKRIHVRVEHIRKSNCRTSFIDRVKENDKLKTEANKKGLKISTKRKPKVPEKAKVVSFNLEEMKVTNQVPYLEIH